MQKTKAFKNLKSTIFLLLIAHLSIQAQDYTYLTSQDTAYGWKKNTLLSITFSQTAFENWAAGGENSLSALGNIVGGINYIDNKIIFDNDFNFAYGFNYQEEIGSRKTDDRLYLSSKFGYKASDNWYYALLGSFETQVAEGYEYGDESKRLISDFMAPGFVIISAGMSYKKNNLNMLISPTTLKNTFVLNDSLSAAGEFGVDPGKSSRQEIGGFVKIEYQNQNLWDNVALKSRLNLFSNYLENPEAIDVDWENIINLKVNDYLSTNLVFNLIYDKDIVDKVQIKEVFGIGFTYKM